jgi:hypothetical protein
MDHKYFVKWDLGEGVVVGNILLIEEFFNKVDSQIVDGELIDGERMKRSSQQGIEFFAGETTRHGDGVVDGSTQDGDGYVDGSTTRAINDVVG